MFSTKHLPTKVMTKEEILELPLAKYLQHPVILETFKPQTIDELVDLALELQDWDPPKYFQELCSYKFMGYDNQNRPVWFCKVGDISIKEIIDRGEVDIMERYCWKALMLGAQSIVSKTKEENPSQQAVCIVDAADVTNYWKFLHGPSLALIYKMVKKYKDGAFLMLGRGIGLNLTLGRVVNFFLKFLHPLAWQTLEKVELYGKDESSWGPRIAEILGQDKLPKIEGIDNGPFLLPYRIVRAP